MIWTTHNCFLPSVAGYLGKYALLLLCFLCSMVFGQAEVGRISFDDVFNGSSAQIDYLVGRFPVVRKGAVLRFDCTDVSLNDVVASEGGSGEARLGVNLFFLREGVPGLQFFTGLRYVCKIQNGEVVGVTKFFRDYYDYQFDYDANDVTLVCRVMEVPDSLVRSFRLSVDIPITTSSSVLMPSYSPVLDMADEQYYDDLTSNFVSIGAVLLAVPLAIFFIYKCWSFVRGGFVAFLLLSSVLAYARGDTNPNPVSTGYIENTDGSTAFYADYVTNQQFADFAGVQTNETYDFNSPYSDVQLGNLDSTEISNLRDDFYSAADAHEAKLQLDQIWHDYYDNRFKGYYESTPIMLFPAALSSPSSGGVSTDTVFSAPPVWEIFSIFDNNSFGYFSVTSAFNLLCNWMGFFFGIGVVIFLIRALTSR